MAKDEIKVISKFMDGTITVGSLKGVVCPKEIKERIGFMLNGFEIEQVERKEGKNNVKTDRSRKCSH